MILDFDIATLSSAPRTFFVLRADYLSKPGGDVDLANALAKQLSAVGGCPELLIAKDLPKLDSDDVLFLFNIDRPYDAIAALKHAPPQTRALLYTLHHPHAGVEAYLRTAVTGAKRLLAFATNHRPERYEAMVDIVKGISGHDPSRVASGLRRRRGISGLLRRCELLVVEITELHAIEAVYGRALRKYYRLRHPVAPSNTLDQSQDLRYALIAGRIEPRKNQLDGLKGLLATDLRARGFEIVVAGGPGSDRNYFRAVVDTCIRNKVIYTSQLPKTLFFPVVSAATLVVNPSFFEVTSLIDLYALTNNIPLLTTEFAWYDASENIARIKPGSWANDHDAIQAAVHKVLPRLNGN